ncbi:merR regulatory family protein [Clostridioides difficile CD160]|nr:merR regulatory family protein [Clostridioides difficile CD160]
MKNYFSIKQAAEIVGMTSETLRHYDRIGIVKPCHRDESSGYRYYSEQELVKLQTIELLKSMDFTLTEIGDILQLDNLHKVIKALKQAEENANKKIAYLQYAKEKIKRAYTDYENKLNNINTKKDDFFVMHIPKRVILISNSMEHASLKNLWNYHEHFYKQLDASLESQFLFEDMAGMITTPEKSRLFAICLKYPSTKGLTTLPEGDYLCANCTEENKDIVLRELLHKLKMESNICPNIIVHIISVTGILQWNYQIQILLN